MQFKKVPNPSSKSNHTTSKKNKKCERGSFVGGRHGVGVPFSRNGKQHFEVKARTLQLLGF